MTFPAFSNDGVGYDAYAELMARRVAEADDRKDYEAMRGNAQQMSEAEITAQMAEEAKPENNVFFGDDVATMDLDDEDLWGMNPSFSEPDPAIVAEEEYVERHFMALLNAS